MTTKKTGTSNETLDYYSKNWGKIANCYNFDADGFPVDPAWYRKNIYNYLSHSDFYVSTSSWEGSSLSMIDSAFIGLPILCSDCPTGRKEFIGNNKRGYIFQDSNQSDFLEKFDQMFSDTPKKTRSKLLEAKKEIKKFTLFSHYRNLNNIF